MKFHSLLLTPVALATAALLVQTGTANASAPHLPGLAQSNFTVSQLNDVRGNPQGNHVIMEQYAKGTTTASFGDQASAISQNFGSQTLSGDTKKAQQVQNLTAGTILQWEAHKVPAWTTALSRGRLDQSQSAWSWTPTVLEQQGAIKRATQVGDTTSKLEAAGAQKQVGSANDPRQIQMLRGHTRAADWTTPSLPTSKAFGIGTSISQIINVAVQNLIQL